MLFVRKGGMPRRSFYLWHLEEAAPTNCLKTVGQGRNLSLTIRLGAGQHLLGKSFRSSVQTLLAANQALPEGLHLSFAFICFILQQQSQALCWDGLASLVSDRTWSWDFNTYHPKTVFG